MAIQIQFQPRNLFTFCYWRCFLLVIKETRVQSECSKIKESNLDKWICEKQDQRTGWDKWPKWIQEDLSCQLSEWLLEIPIWKTILTSRGKALSFPQQRYLSKQSYVVPGTGDFCQRYSKYRKYSIFYSESLSKKLIFFQISVIWKLTYFFVKKRYPEHTQAMKILMRVWVCFFIRHKISLNQVSRTGQEFPQTDYFLEARRQR